MTNQERKQRKEDIKLHRQAIADLRTEPTVVLIIRRIIMFLPILLMFLVSSAIFSFQNTLNYTLFGGEVLVYSKRTNKKSFNDIYNLLLVKLK